MKKILRILSVISITLMSLTILEESAKSTLVRTLTPFIKKPPPSITDGEYGPLVD